MLQIKEISKKYITGELTQDALDRASFNLRDNEFVAILGQSGSGKTTLLNIIGGLDRYDSGDIVINNISTKKYTDRDWDSYRNHTIGFVFQSYNLIPHQSILANVELALTISGISKSERRRRAKKALEEVGLGGQFHKRPNQMSGGQMQRVAIARALVNDPDILLADEPTGALDSETSVQVMKLLQEVAKDRLVVMVTHNSELADEYANRIIRLHDGRVIDDTNPFIVKENSAEPPKHKNLGKASMSFITALSLSFNNLRTKMGRTLLTSFAGSIGIIGIALILSLSTGVNDYITSIQKDTMTSYPISLQATTFDLSSMLSGGNRNEGRGAWERTHELDGVYSNTRGLRMASAATTSIKSNNLTDFKHYLDDPNSEIHQYLGENGIVYSYDTKFNVYAYDPEGVLVNTDGSTFNTGSSAMNSAMGASMGSAMSSAMSSMTSTSHFEELLPGKDGELLSAAVTDPNNYELLYGRWPSEYNEVVLILNEDNEIAASTLYELGLLPADEYRDILKKIDSGEEVSFDTRRWSYQDIAGHTFYLIPACDMYVENENGLYNKAEDGSEALTMLLENGIQLKISGVVRSNEDASYAALSGTVGYLSTLTDYIIEHTDNSAVVKAQQSSPDVNILNGMSFSPQDDAAKAADAAEYLSNLNISGKAALFKAMMSMYGSDPATQESLNAMGEAEMAGMLDQYLAEPQPEMLLAIYDSYISTGNYDDNIKAFGLVSLDAPSAINIYVDSFEDKDAIAASIANYNETVDEENQITYTDYVALLMSSVTTIINVISYVLIAFVAVSLVVSSIMIGIITYISVLERTKEIGILRAIGASKHNISQVFNAETFIIGLCAGLIGVGLTLLILIPGNAIIHAVAGTTDVSAALPVVSALILVALSMILTLIAGLIPAKKAARKDPVIALRSE